MKKKVIILVISIIVVLLILSTTTYALFFRKDKLENTESYTAGILDIVIENDEEGLGETLNLANSLPITDEEGKSSTPYRFKITNKGNLAYTFDLQLNNTTTSNQINTDYIKIMVDNNEPVSLSNLDNNIIASDLTLNPGESKIISIRIWLDINTPNTEIGKVFSAKITSNGVGSEPPITYPKIDNSGANAPAYVENLIPIMYDGTNWVKADTTSSTSTYGWYDYDAKKWANAVLVSSTNRETYVNASVGTVIPESDVLAYYVWIPRYKYKVFNITKTIGTDSYNAENTGIDIVFEDGTASTGEITCNYDFTITDGSLSEVCSGTNGEYYTHPAFTFGDTELTGIWIGKFEVSSSDPSAEYGGGDSTTITVRVKPNVISWRENSVSNFYTVIKNMQSSGNEYGLNSDTSQVDSHMTKNMDWGAVSYLTHSDYGRCSNGSCNEIGINNNWDYITGCGAYAGSSSSGTCNEYTTTLGMNASTTGNIYGIYDLSVGAYEYVMGNMSSGSGSYTYNARYAGSNFSYSTATAKYIDTYAYGTSWSDQTAYNRARLGDATGEVVVSSGTAWNNDYADFVSSSYPWFQRGGYCNNGDAGLFCLQPNSGHDDEETSSRASLIVY